MLLCFSVVAEAQTQSDAFLQYRQRQAAAANAYKQRQEEALQSYKDKRRKAYAEYMRKKWEAFNIEFPEVQPLRPEPVEPVVKPIEEEATAPKEVIEEVAAPEEVTAPEEEVIEEVAVPEEVVEEVTVPEDVTVPEEVTAPEEVVEEAAEEVIEEVIEEVAEPEEAVEEAVEEAAEPEPAPEPAPEPEPLPIPESEPVVVGEGMTLSFFGAECSITLTEAHRFKLRSIYEKDVAAAWESLNNSNFDNLIAECTELKESLRLNDWGMYLLVKQLAEEFFGENINESVVLRAFILTDLGYKVRIARANSRLWLMTKTEHNVYNHLFAFVGKDKYILFDMPAGCKDLYTCNFEFEGEEGLNLSLNDTPALPYAKGTTFTRCNTRNGEMLQVVPNENLTAFLREYPHVDWSVYAETALSEMTYMQIARLVKQRTANKSEREAVQSILSMIHHFFPYKNDAQQFGYERTFFADELFSYMYSDCEDRSILFCRLVKEILGLDVVLLHYPQHIAAAVHFTTTVSGDHVMVGTDRYVICDATYINSYVGEAMPECKDVAPKIIIVE